MKSGITIDVPVKHHVLHYLHSKFGAHPLLSRFDADGVTFLNLLGNKRHHQDKRTISYPTTITLYITMENCKRYGYELTPFSIMSFNNYVEDQIYKQFDAHMLALVGVSKMTKASAIRAFQDMYGYNEDVLKYETLKKHYDRAALKETFLKVA